jgi:hypothetical protein
MSNEIKSGNMNEHGGSGKNDPNRTTDAPKSAQQSHGTAPQTGKSATQQGSSDHKSGQQSQGGSQKDSGGTKQSGSGHVADQKQPSDQGHKGGHSK